MPNGERKFLGDVIMAVGSAVRRICQQETEGRKGGMFRLYRHNDSNGPTLIFTTVHGEPTEGKFERYWHFSAEKACRLAEYHLAGHVSSFQSRDDDREMYPGAIRAGEYYLSFSGLPSLADEAVCLLAAVDVGLLSREQALAIGKISDNKFLFTEWGSGLHQV